MPPTPVFVIIITGIRCVEKTVVIRKAVVYVLVVEAVVIRKAVSYVLVIETHT